MKSHEAIKRAIGTNADEFAKRFRKSWQLIYKWAQPSADYSDSGALNPVDRVELLCETSLALGTNPEDALAPLDYLNHRFGRVAFSMPKDIGTPEQESKELLRLMQESGDVVREYNEAVADQRISRQDLAKIEREVWESAKQAMVFLEAVRRAVK